MGLPYPEIRALCLPTTVVEACLAYLRQGTVVDRSPGPGARLSSTTVLGDVVCYPWERKIRHVIWFWGPSLRRPRISGPQVSGKEGVPIHMNPDSVWILSRTHVHMNRNCPSTSNSRATYRSTSRDGILALKHRKRRHVIYSRAPTQEGAKKQIT